MSLMKDRYFIDTNIIIYMFDKDHPDKREIAVKIVKEALESNFGCISYQVIQEFCNVALKKFKIPMSAGDCRYFIQEFLIPMCSVFPGTELYFSALEISESTQYSFYDSLIIASSLSSGCTSILTENMQHNQIVRGVKIINPFL
ncbi:MAG: tRNA(fMet)-specific endonuclease VapC [Firmicutes bacterium ADurb.Bin146]|nr:MAG: tRNA(fMet)-specific endonuclease VapC [Firmicutes bacterium ADurb.Bin146]